MSAMPILEGNVTKLVCAMTLAVVSAACGGADMAATAEGTAATETVASAAAPAVEAPRAAVPTYREVTVPAGTSLRLELASVIASDSSQVEDAVRAQLREAVTVDGLEVLPVGSEVSGVVTDVAQSGRVKGRARVAYRFVSLRHDREGYAIRTDVIAHEADASKGEDAKKIAIGAGAGAAVGAILGGGSGAAKGAAIGGAGGTGAVLATRGEEVRRGPGAQVTTRLTEPLTVRIKM